VSDHGTERVPYDHGCVWFQHVRHNRVDGPSHRITSGVKKYIAKKHLDGRLRYSCHIAVEQSNNGLHPLPILNALLCGRRRVHLGLNLCIRDPNLVAHFVCDFSAELGVLIEDWASLGNDGWVRWQFELSDELVQLIAVERKVD